MRFDHEVAKEPRKSRGRARNEPRKSAKEPQKSREAAAKELRKSAKEARKKRKRSAKEVGDAGGGKCYLPNAVFLTPDGNFMRAKSIALECMVRSVDGQAVQVARVSRHQSREKQHIVEFVTAQGNFKTSSSHKICVPGTLAQLAMSPTLHLLGI